MSLLHDGNRLICFVYIHQPKTKNRLLTSDAVMT